jgi:acetate kinase
VVHGGETLRAPVRIDDAVLERVEALTPLAPLHNPLNLIGISAARGVLPQLPQVAVFDTAFHQTMAPDAFLYAIPRYLYDAHGIRRYGFHGTSHEWVSLEAGRRLGGGSLGLVTAHLGNGCSATAVWDGASVDTTMGLTPLEGLVMGTRSGDVDPGALPRIGEIASRDLAGVVELLNRESGLLGLSGLSNDMRVLLDRRREGDNDAKVAIDVFCHRLARAIGGLAAALPRFDGLVFTGGIGEHAWEIRRDVLTRLRSFGFELDPVANERHGRDTGGIITTSTSRAALVIATREELMIARHAWAVVTDGGELDG